MATTFYLDTRGSSPWNAGSAVQPASNTGTGFTNTTELVIGSLLVPTILVAGAKTPGATLSLTNNQLLSVSGWVLQAEVSTAIAAGNWTVAVGIMSTVASWAAVAGLYVVNGTTNAIRSTIFATQVVGASSRSSTSGTYSVYSTAVSGAAATMQPWDYLVLKVGGKNVSGSTQSYTFQVDTNGSTAISSDNVSISASNAQSLIICPGFSPAGGSDCTLQGGFSN